MEKQDKKFEKPGTLVKIMSFIPGLNWISLIVLWWKYNNTKCLIMGIVCALIVVGIPRFTGVIWYFVVVCYNLELAKIVKKNTSSVEHKEQSGNED